MRLLWPSHHLFHFYKNYLSQENGSATSNRASSTSSVLRRRDPKCLLFVRGRWCLQTIRLNTFLRRSWIYRAISFLLCGFHINEKKSLISLLTSSGSPVWFDSTVILSLDIIKGRCKKVFYRLIRWINETLYTCKKSSQRVDGEASNALTDEPINIYVTK